MMKGQRAFVDKKMPMKVANKTPMVTKSLQGRQLGYKKGLSRNKLIGTGNCAAHFHWSNFGQIKWHKAGIGTRIDANDKSAQLDKEGEILAYNPAVPPELCLSDLRQKYKRQLCQCSNRQRQTSTNLPKGQCHCYIKVPIFGQNGPQLCRTQFRPTFRQL
jgi:hypothetical protein